jgi:hypothetical protein
MMHFKLTKMRERGILDHFIKSEIESFEKSSDYICTGNQSTRFEGVRHTSVGV